MQTETIVGCVVAAVLAVFSASGEVKANRIEAVGDYPSHLQGGCTDGASLWWSHTTELVRTDLDGQVLAHAKGLQPHHGDLCVVSGTVYVAVNHGKFNTEQGADSWVYAYRGDDLTFITRWKVPELRHGAGGMTWRGGHFFVVGGLPPTHSENYVYEYTPAFEFVDRHVLKSGWTNLGIQTVDFSGGRFLFGCYGGKNKLSGEKVPTLTLMTPPDFSHVEKIKEDTSVGVCRFGGRLWRATLSRVGEESPRRYTVALVPTKSSAFNHDLK